MAGFLGVHLERQGTSIKLTQKGLIKRVIEALGVDRDNRTATTPAKEPLPIDKDGDPPNRDFHYASVIGMLNTYKPIPDLTLLWLLASAQDMFMHPNCHMKRPLIRIGQYLKKTAEEGLIFRPSAEFAIDCFVDADFAGLWGYKNPIDPSIAKSRTGFVICISNCPVIWASKLQTSIAP